MSSLNNTPPVLPYLLALAVKLTGGGEFPTRALFLPFDLAAAWSLLALAGRFLKKPLWPTLALLAGPAWALNMNHLMAERVMAGFAFPALWLAVVAIDEDDAVAYAASAVLAACALLSKYNAVFLLPTVAAYGYSRRADLKSLLLWSVGASSGLILYFAVGLLRGNSAGLAAVSVLSASSSAIWSSPVHKLRSLLAFTGGLSLATGLWLVRLTPNRRSIAVVSGLSAVLFVPFLDLAPLVRPVDRFAGFLFTVSAVLTVWALFRAPRSRGFVLWSSWIVTVAFLQWGYWSVLARFIVLLLPPLTFWSWERLEASHPLELETWGRLGFAASLALGAACASVDRTFADAQRSVAAQAAADLRPGARLWCAGHWGLQEYARAFGGEELDQANGGWDAVKPGDRVLTARVNANLLKPSRPLLADARTVRVGSPVPIRLISGWTGEGGFYTNATGFLPWTLSAEPVDEITIVEAK